MSPDAAIGVNTAPWLGLTVTVAPAGTVTAWFAPAGAVAGAETTGMPRASIAGVPLFWASAAPEAVRASAARMSLFIDPSPVVICTPPRDPRSLGL